jgi:hypothetical protein
MTARDRLRALLAEEISQPAPDAAQRLAAAIRARHGAGIAAIVFYGSCLRQPGGTAEERVFDFYVIVDGYRAFYRGLAAAALNRWLPPNVFHVTAEADGRMLRGKYAVVASEHLRRLVSRGRFEPYFWARFAQPTRVVYARDDGATTAVVEALADAVATLLERVAPLLPTRFSPMALWVGAFRQTYAAELRAERGDRAEAIYRADAERYRALTEPALAAAGFKPRALADGTVALDRPPAAGWGPRRAWALRRWQGKLLSVARLAKAVFTFEAGLDYILWKIERHSGVRTEVTDWQRRHPLLAAPALAWRLYRRGAFR